MKLTLRVLLGAVLGTVALWVSVSVYIYALSAAWSPWSNLWWAHHPTVVSTVLKIFAFAPCVVALGVIFARLFKTWPIPSAFVAMSIAIVIAYADTFRTLEPLPPTVRMTWELIATFLGGPPLIVYLLNRLRSNNPFERSRAASSVSQGGSR